MGYGVDGQLDTMVKLTFMFHRGYRWDMAWREGTDRRYDDADIYVLQGVIDGAWGGRTDRHYDDADIYVSQGVIDGAWGGWTDPVNMRRLAHRRRRWPNSKPTLDQRVL